MVISVLLLAADLAAGPVQRTAEPSAATNKDGFYIVGVAPAEAPAGANIVISLATPYDAGIGPKLAEADDVDVTMGGVPAKILDVRLVPESFIVARVPETAPVGKPLDVTVRLEGWVATLGKGMSILQPIPVEVTAESPVQRIVVDPQPRGSLSVNWFALAASLALLIGLVSSLLLNLRRKQAALQRRLSQLSLTLGRNGSPEPPAVEAPAGPRRPLPAIPQELIDACNAGNCVLFAGGGLAVQLGYPHAVEVLSRIITRLERESGDPASWEGPRAALASRPDHATEILAARIPRDRLLSMLKEAQGRDGSVPAPMTRALRSIPFRSALTSSWSRALEDVWPATPVATFADVERLATALKGDSKVILKIHGDPERPEGCSLTTEEYRRALYENAAFAKYVNAMFFNQSLLFLGNSLDGIEEFLSGLAIRTRPQQAHFALVPWRSGFELHAERFAARFGITLLPFDPSPGYPEVLEFCRLLGSRTASAPATAARPMLRDMRIDRVVLENVGAFAKLDLALNQGWNVLLGNNGCGKSTILRAIGLAACGDDERMGRAARQLLRAGTTSGFIELRSGQNAFRTDLVRDGQRVIVRAQGTPLQTASVVIVGYPALRGVSTRNPEGAASVPAGEPSVDDLLPLVTNAVDTRMNDLKQWLVNLDTAKTSASQRIRDDFFALMSVLFHGVDLQFSHVNPVTWEVMVKTADGVVPIDVVSQGMGSLLGWAGLLIERLHEIHGAQENPRSQPAVVLVDEIEAHMHPEWQHRIVAVLRERFPNLQMIATTHSPLVVAGMTCEEVLCCVRDRETGAVSVKNAPMEIAGLRADQILTSPLFGLISTRSASATRDVTTFTELLSKPQRSAQEEVQLNELRPRVEKILAPAETELGRRVHDAVNKTLADMGTAALADPKVQAEVKVRLASLLDTERQ